MSKLSCEFNDSTALYGVLYDTETQHLEISFTGGNYYTYTGVEEDVYYGLVRADSAGQYYNQHIRDQYDGWSGSDDSRSIFKLVETLTLADNKLSEASQDLTNKNDRNLDILSRDERVAIDAFLDGLENKRKYINGLIKKYAALC